MESYTPNPFEDDKKPDETGSSEASKKKKKKSAKFPLPVKKEKADSTVDRADKPSKEGKEQPDEQTAKGEASPESDIQPEADQVESSDGEAYQGELVIDHSDDELVLPALAEEAGDTAPQHEVQSAGQQVAETTQETDHMPADPIPVPPPFWHIGVPDWYQRSAESAGSTYQADRPESLSGTVEQSAVNSDALADVSVDGEAVSVQDAARRSYRAEQRGLSRGVASSALAGWWFGRRSGRHQIERSVQPQLQRNEQKLQQIMREVSNLDDVSKRRESVLNRTQEKLQTLLERTRDIRVLPRREEQPPATRAEVPVNEREPVSAAETPKKPEIKKASAEKPIPHLPTEKPAESEQPQQAPKGRRYEMSAWHRVEVDEKTGRLAEKPATEYGEAFHNEQQQEKLVHSAAKAQTAAQVGMTLLAAEGATGQQAAAQPTATAQSFATKPAKKKQPSQLQAMLQDTEYIRQQLTQNATNPSIWLTALAVVVFLLLSGVL